jgi:hypothetical protein
MASFGPFSVALAIALIENEREGRKYRHEKPDETDNTPGGQDDEQEKSNYRRHAGKSGDEFP